MAIRNILKGGTTWTEEGLKPSDLNDTFNSFFTKTYADNTGGSLDSNSSTAETDLATLTVLTADFNAGSTDVDFLIAGGFRGLNNDNVGKTWTFRLYVNGSIVKTIVTDTLSNASSTSVADSGTFTYLATANDLSSSNVIVKITAQPSGAGSNPGNCVGTVFGLTVQAIRDN